MGTGTFGRVRVVQHRPSKAWFALKIMKKSEILRLKQVGGGWASVAVTAAAVAAAERVPWQRGGGGGGGGGWLMLVLFPLPIATAPPPPSLPPPQVDHIKSECRILAQVNHPFIVNM